MPWRLSCVIALLVWQQAAPPAPPPAAVWQPAGVYQRRDVDVPPRVVQEVKPNYTRTAIQARIQGEVGLSCVVLADGTVGEVRVTKSLDAVLGLDDEAIKAVKQWRFSPAMKAGSAVPVIVDVNLSFTLRSGTEPPPALTWPDGFDAPVDQPAKPAEWTEETFEVRNLRIKISYPPDWTLVKSPNEHTMISLAKGGEATLLTVGPPQPSSFSLDHPLSPERLRAVADRIESGAAERGMQLESLGFGQAPAASHVWAWHAWKMVSFATPGMSAIGGAAIKQLYDGGRMWSFEGTAGDSAFSIACLTGIPRRLPDAERASYVASRAATFGEILRRMSISVVR